MLGDKLRMSLDEFLRLYPMRAPQVMWFLGAGASASAGIKTAYDMIWEFKRSIYCSRERVSLRACDDLSDPVVRQRIQAYFDSSTPAPQQGAPEEYSFFFETTYPDEADRQRYVHQLAEEGVPSFGHVALATLMKTGRVKCVWTTNFDSVVEDSVAQVFGKTSSLTVADLDSADLASQALAEHRWPLLVKLHGDFRSRRLKNTADELRAQDDKLRDSLVQSLRTGGLAVVGCSGRDESVMGALEEAVASGKGYPAGLFWFCRSESSPLSRVEDLIATADSLGVDAHLIAVETFDELMGDVVSLIPEAPEDLQAVLDSRPRRLTEVRVPGEKGVFPAIRFNAFPVLRFPSLCRRIQCDIGGAADVRNAVEESQRPVLAGRRNVGVIAFGADEDIRACFEPFNIQTIDLHRIEFHRLRYNSAEHGLLADAIWRGIVRERPVLGEKRGRTRWVTIDPKRTSAPDYAQLRDAIGKLHGRLPNSEISWRESVKVRLVGLGDNLWFVVDPAIWFDLPEASGKTPSGGRVPAEAKEFARQKAATRYNPVWNAMFDGWGEVLLGKRPSITFDAFGCTSGVDAEFEIGRTSAFSWRGK